MAKLRSTKSTTSSSTAWTVASASFIYGRTVVEHDQRLCQVLDRLVKYNATVRRDTCVIGVLEVDYNGHRLSAAGIHPLTLNVEAI